jgi:hypothetical protein
LEGVVDVPKNLDANLDADVPVGTGSKVVGEEKKPLIP